MCRVHPGEQGQEHPKATPRNQTGLAGSTCQNGEIQTTHRRRFDGKKRYDEAFQEVRKDIRENGKSHYMLANLSEIYLSKGLNISALKTAREAERITKRCLLVRLALGKALAATGNTDEAVATFKGIINQDFHSLAHGECGEGLRSARTFKAEAYLCIARIYRKVGISHEALSWYRRCLMYRKRNGRKMMRCDIPLDKLKKEITELSHLIGCHLDSP